MIGKGAQLALLAGAAVLAYVVRDHLSTPYDAKFEQYGQQYGIEPNYLRATARKETGFRPSVIGVTGDVGLMQIKPSTGAAFGYSKADLLNVDKNIVCACKVAAENIRTLGGSLSRSTLAASYNVGPASAKRGNGQGYAADVTTHWRLYDFGRMFA